MASLVPLASTLALVVVAGPAHAAGEPTSVTVASGDSTLTVSWTAPTDVTPATYEVRHREKDTTPESTWTTSSAISHPTAAYTVSSLTNGKTYEVQIRTSSPGPSDWTASAEGTAGAPATPSAPTLTSGNKQLGVSWTAPATNGSAITDYDVRYREPGAHSWNVLYDGGKLTSSKSNSDTSDGPGGDPLDLGELTELGSNVTRESIGANQGVYRVETDIDRMYLWIFPNFSGSATMEARYASTKPTASNLATHGTQLWSVSAGGRGHGWITSLAAGSYFWVTASEAVTVSSVIQFRVWVDLESTSTAATIPALANNTNYEVQVRAANARGNGSWSPSATLKTGLPAAPAAPTVTPGSSELAVSWTTPDGHGSLLTDYDVRYSSNSGSSWTTHPHTGTGTSTTISTLTSGTSYQVQVRATNGRGDGPWSPSTTMTAGVPVAPTAPTLTSGNQSLAVAWAAPSTTNGSTITDYDVRYSSDSGATWAEWDASTTSTATTAGITGLTNDTTYEVQVRASNGRGAGPWSAATALKAGAPSAPSAPTLTSGNTQLGVSWTAPADSGSAITDYDVRYSSDSGATWAEWAASTTSTATTVTITGLTNNTSYQVQVRAANARADGAWGPSATLKAGLPAAPTAPTLTPDNTALSVSWTAPAANGSNISDYDVQYSSDSGSTWTEWDASTTSTTTSATITGLTNDATYQVQVRAANAVGDGPWSPSSSATPTAQKPSAPTAPTLTSGNASLSVKWTAPAANGSSITDYDVQYSSDVGATWTAHTHTGTGTSTTISSLTNNTSYQVQVRAVNGVGNGPWSASTTLKAGLPAAPAAPLLTPGNASLTAAWSAPADHGTTLSGYDVQYSSDSGATWVAHTHTGTGTSATISPLVNGTSYQVQVRAKSSVGAGPWSASSTMKAGVPFAPVVPSLTVDNETLEVAWTAPGNNGAAITDYDVRFRADGTTAWTQWKASNTSTTTTATITGLANGTTYQVSVRAANSRGDGPWSASTSAAPAAQVPDAPIKPTGSSSFLAWYPAPKSNGSTIIGYDFQYSTDSGANWEELKLDRIISVPFLTPTDYLPGGDTYVLQIRAVNSVGPSAWSPTSVSFTLPTRAPDKAAAPKLSSDDGELTVKWTQSGWTPPNDNGSSITSYNVRYARFQSLNWTAMNGISTTTTETTITGLTNNWTYEVQVQATNSVGTGSWSPSTIVRVGVPPTPSAPTLTSGNAQLGVSWTVDTGAVTISGYDVQYRVVGASNWSSHTHTGTTKSTTISTLTNGTSYEVQVRAKGGRGSGLWSDSSTEKPGKPAAPSAPTLTSSNAQLAVSWTAPTTNGLSITDYDVQYSSDSGTTWAEWDSSTTSTTTSATITGLTAGTYQVQVRAASSAGDGPWSGSASKVVKTVPLAPGMPKLTSGNAQLAVSWTAPANGGSAITDYDVQYRASGTATWTSNAHTGTATTSTISGLINGATYEVQVRASNTLGPGAWSASDSATAGPPSAPLDVWVLPRNTSLEVSWLDPATDNGSAVTDYDVRYRAVGTSAWSYTADGTPSTHWKQTISSLQNGTAYEVQARAENANGAGPWSASVRRDPGAPGEPRRPRLTAGNGQLEVSWSAPSDHGSSITDYDVRYCDISDGECLDNDTRWTEWDASTTSTATSTTITGLANGVIYWVQVRAANARGNGAWSHTSGRKTLIGPEFQACKLDGTTTLIYGGSCDIEAGQNGVESFDHVGIQETPNTTGEPLLLRNRERDGYVRLIAFNPNGGTATVNLSLNNDPRTAQTFTISMPAFGIRSVTAVGGTGVVAGDTFKLRVQLDYPANLSEVDETYSGYPMRSWVQLAFPANSGFTGIDRADSNVYVSSPTQIVGQHKDVVEFTVKAGTTVGMHQITVTAKTPWSGWDCANSDPNETCFRPIDPTDTTVTYSVRTNDATMMAVTAQAGVPASPPERVVPKLTGTVNSLTAVWEPPSSPAAPIIAYQVQYRHHPNGAWTVWETLGADARSSTITHLQPGGIYRIRIRAENAFGWGDYSWPFAEITLVKPSTEPPAALAWVAVSRAAGELKVSWSAVQGATGYNVVYTSDHKQSWKRAYTEISSTSATITGADDNAAYYVSVQAVNAAGTNNWLDSDLISPQATDVPGQFTPTLVPGEDSIKVAWTSPENNGSAITAYQIEMRRHPGGTWTVIATLDASAVSHLISDLEPGATYRVRMRARNAAGWGEKSWPLAETTLGARGHFVVEL